MPEQCKGRLLLRTAPLPAPGNRYWACPPWRVFPPEELLEVENDSGGNAQVVLCLIVTVGDFRQMRQQVVELQRADRETVRTFQSTPAPNAVANAVWELDVANTPEPARAPPNNTWPNGEIRRCPR